MSMDLGELILKYPYLASPAALASADMDGKFVMTAMHERINRELIEYAFGDTMRLMINLPFQHGKTTLATIYNTAWKLLWKPDNQFLIIGAEEEFAWGFGGKIKDIIEKWGPNHGIELKKDTRAKGWWQIRGKLGGVVCKGCHGTVVGRPADDVLCDDLVTGPEDALSKTKMDMRWEFIRTSVYSRLRAHTKMAMVNTRWCKNDPCGRILQTAKRTGEDWKVLKFKAISGEGDILGRRPGEALCPQQVSLKQLQMYQKDWGRWWHAAWQQEPIEEDGAHFKTGFWPRYQEAERGWMVPINGVLTRIRRDDVCIIISVDWAASEKKNADFTCIAVYGLFADGRLLVLDIINERFPLEKSVPELAKACEHWRPALVVVEAGGFQTTMAIECRKFPAIPEPRRMTPYGKTKLQRALHAITLGEGKRIYLPEKEPPWFDTFEEQLVSFTGDNDEHDDICLAPGTLIRTIDGEVPIEKITPGVMVATREGWRPVVASGRTAAFSQRMTVIMSDGKTLTGTPSHQVWVKGKGFVSIDSLDYGDTMLSWKTKSKYESKPSNSTVERTAVTRTQKNATTGSTSPAIANRNPLRSSFTEKFGSLRTAPFRKGTTFTTLMGTRSTTTLPTSSVLPEKNTGDWMQSAALTKAPPSTPILTEFDRSLQRGTEPQKERRGIQKTQGSVSPNANHCRGFAFTAEQNGNHWQEGKPTNSVPPHALRLLDEHPELTTKKEYAPAVVASTSRTKHRLQKHALVRVLGVFAAPPGPVFNLKTERTPEFFANGILVHNCDTLGMAATQCQYLVPATMATGEPQLLVEGYSPFYT